MCFWISFKSVLRCEPSSKLFDSWGLFDPHTTNPYHIWHQILFWNTLEINYLHYLIEFMPQGSPLGHVLVVYFDLIKILGVEKVEVPIDITS